ncbi:chemotaxis protein CheD [Parasporobacterium paucivorans]|uniref:Probable chemoreceptor glutamine deamidase CheD n=1 Tax=Parasporobacterium paucivorans DSM 15970 TaxID=1122934 RepID=A0A1M6IAF0_9FIRM|nr:chemotaxis protein CheD [Parasporobacterium paucivorans]SHJ31348.1 chemotaxis protein CheD [Parasporobacterium paucivorans DSM 15970]
MNKNITVGIADMKIARGEGTIVTHALGSCIGITFYDPMIRLGAMVHIMLPECRNIKDTSVFKYADSGIKETLRKLSAYGGSRARMECKIAGGAKMFEFKGGGELGNIGLRNAESVRRILKQEGLTLRGEDTGSNYARTMSLELHTGNVTIKTYGRAEISL